MHRTREPCQHGRGLTSPIGFDGRRFVKKFTTRQIQNRIFAGLLLDVPFEPAFFIGQAAITVVATSAF
jgi:hypothetical protein